MCVATNPKPLLIGSHADQPSGCMRSYPTKLVSKDSFQLMPAVKEPRCVAWKTKVDHIFTITWIELFLLVRRQKVVNTSFIGRTVPTLNATERLPWVAR